MSGQIPMVDVAESFPISDTRLIVVCEFGHRMERPRKRRAEWTGYGNQMMSIEDPPPKRVRCKVCALPSPRPADEGNGRSENDG